MCVRACVCVCVFYLVHLYTAFGENGYAVTKGTFAYLIVKTEDKMSWVTFVIAVFFFCFFFFFFFFCLFVVFLLR